jgi:hypothetical protein
MLRGSSPLTELGAGSNPANGWRWEVERTASCACGQLSVTVRGDPKMHGICSCLECQKLTGSTFFHHGYWPISAVQALSGKSASWRRSSDSGRWTDNHFCPLCGSCVYAFAEFDPDVICISIGSFADPAFPAPQYSIWERHKHSWLQIPRDCERLDTQP